MNVTDFEIAQASVELMGGLVCAMLAVVIIINSHRIASTRHMEYLLFTTAALLVCDAVCFIFRGNTDRLSIWLNQGGNFAVFMLDLLLSCCSIQFVYSLLLERHAAPKDIYRRIVLVCSLAGGLIVLSNLFTGWMYYFDAENRYHRNWGWYVYTALSAVSLVTACILVLHYRKCLSVPRLISLLLFELFPIIAVVIQSFFYGLAITNMGIGISVILLLLSYLVTWSRSNGISSTPLLRHSYDTIILFIIMAVSISASIVSCIFSIRRVANDISLSNSQLIAHIVGDQIEEMLDAPITVAQTMSNDRNLQKYLQQSTEDPNSIQEEISGYLESIRTGFGYQMVFAVCNQSGAYYTDSGLIKHLDPSESRDDQWYQSAIGSGRECIVYMGNDADNGWGPTVFINAVVRDADGAVLGICGVALKISELQSLMSEFEAQYHIKITLLDQEGQYQIDSANTAQAQFSVPEELEHASEQEFVHQQLSGATVLTRRMDSLHWYLTVEDLEPEKVDVLRTVVPNVLIFLVGLSALLVAFCVILVRERKIARELQEKRKNSLYDELTGLKNRRALREDCSVLEGKDAIGALAVIQMDLNGLKFTNDTYGHQAGDELIIGMADCMIQAMQCYGELYRTGGDEFVAILMCGSSALKPVLADFDRLCSEWKSALLTGISSARGVVFSEEHPSLSLAGLIDLADQKMYEEKRLYYLKTGKQRRT